MSLSLCPQNQALTVGRVAAAVQGMEVTQTAILSSHLAPPSKIPSTVLQETHQTEAPHPYIAPPQSSYPSSRH